MFSRIAERNKHPSSLFLSGSGRWVQLLWVARSACVMWDGRRACGGVWTCVLQAPFHVRVPKCMTPCGNLCFDAAFAHHRPPRKRRGRLERLTPFDTTSPWKTLFTCRLYISYSWCQLCGRKVPTLTDTQLSSLKDIDASCTRMTSWREGYHSTFPIFPYIVRFLT